MQKYVPRKGFGSADCDTIFTIYPPVRNQLIRTLFEAHIVFSLLGHFVPLNSFSPILY